MIFASSGTWDLDDPPESVAGARFDRYVLKTATPGPTEGPDFRQPLDGGGYLNRVGLKNRGIDWTLANRPAQLASSQIVVSVYGSWVRQAQKCQQHGVEWVELNLSCPNLAGPAPGYSREAVEMILRAVREFTGTVTLKFPPDVPGEVLRASRGANYWAFNALPTRSGALSGAPLKPLMLDTVRRAARLPRRPQIIASGGIGCSGSVGKDVDEFFAAGAEHWAMGTRILQG